MVPSDQSINNTSIIGKDTVEHEHELEHERNERIRMMRKSGSLYTFYQIISGDDKHFPYDLNMFDVLILIWMCYKNEMYHLDHTIRYSKLFCFRILFLQLFKEYFKRLHCWKDKLSNQFSLIIYFDNLKFTKYHPSIQFDNETRSLVIPKTHVDQKNNHETFETVRELPDIKYQVILAALAILQDRNLSFLNDKIPLINFLIESQWLIEYTTVYHLLSSNINSNTTNQKIQNESDNNKLKMSDKRYTNDVYGCLSRLKQNLYSADILLQTNKIIDFELNRLNTLFAKYYFEKVFNMTDAVKQSECMAIYVDIKEELKPFGKIVVRQDHGLILNTNWYSIESQFAQNERFGVKYEYFKFHAIDLSVFEEDGDNREFIQSLAWYNINHRHGGDNGNELLENKQESTDEKFLDIYDNDSNAELPKERIFKQVLSFENECVRVLRTLASQIQPSFERIVKFALKGTASRIGFDNIRSQQLSLFVWFVLF